MLPAFDIQPHTLFENADVPAGPSAYAEAFAAETFLKMPANALVNVGYLVVGGYWLYLCTPDTSGNMSERVACKTCGIFTFGELTEKPGHFRVNLGCVEGVDPLGLEITLIDGKSF